MTLSQRRQAAVAAQAKLYADYIVLLDLFKRQSAAVQKKYLEANKHRDLLCKVFSIQAEAIRKGYEALGAEFRAIGMEYAAQKRR